MKNTITKLLRLFIGYFLYGLGIVLTLNANQGLAPWSVFHQGLAYQLNITMGIATQLVGLVIMFGFHFWGKAWLGYHRQCNFYRHFYRLDHAKEMDPCS